MKNRKKSGKRPASRKIEYLSLGCDKNLVDTEKALSRFQARGFEPVPVGQGGETLIINTCSFIDAAKEESIEQILLAVERKKRGELKKIIVAGCLVELFKKQLAKEIPEVDEWIKFSELENYVGAGLGLPKKDSGKIGARQALPLQRIITTPKHLSYLKIAEGCDQGCKFCIIPKIRGRFRSIPEKDLLDEARFLEDSGVKELNLVAQDLCAYGTDIGSSLPKLLEKLLARTKIPWLRLFYLNPEGLTCELIDMIASEERICSYIDLPFQHISDPVLKNMGRRAREKKIRSLVEELRVKIPGVALRGTALVGFPGETDDDFENLYAFVEETRFDWLGVFAFSPQEGSRAFAMKGRVPEPIVQKRKTELESLSFNLAEQKNLAKIGDVVEVLVDGGSDSGFDYQGRSFAQAYEIDGVIHLRGRFAAGKFFQVRIMESLGLDLVGEKK
jgi:ribosomal protein S12 methylthiotransferase